MENRVQYRGHVVVKLCTEIQKPIPLVISSRRSCKEIQIRAATAYRKPLLAKP